MKHFDAPPAPAAATSAAAPEARAHQALEASCDAAFEADLAATRQAEKTLTAAETLPLWARLYDDHTDQPQAFRFLLRALIRAGRNDDAYLLLEDAPELADTPQEASHCAECIAELRELPRARALFFRLLERAPENARVMTIFGKYLKGAGDLLTARAVLEEVPLERRSPTAADLLAEVCGAIDALERIAPGVCASLPETGPALAAAISTFESRELPGADLERCGGISLYTGSLGAGGAERQLTRIATSLAARARHGKAIAGRRIEGQVEVLVNSAEASRKKDFFRPELEAAGVPVSILRDMPRTRVDALTGVPAVLKGVLPSLPPHVRFGLEHLVAHLRRTCPEVLYIWQDGAVLSGVLAALVAGVPRICVSLRGLPPNMRPHLMKPQYRDMYRALARIPGVALSCNSIAAAQAYAAWLDLPASTFSVLYNASLPLPRDGADDERALWRAFTAATPEGGRTIGGIYRFNENKRWDLWVRAAAARLATNPDDRFVLVGDGDDRIAAEEAARREGVSGRLLFVGHSKSVGFWLSKMDAVVHLSRHEGLPNVLIEAQMAGVPVVATPAGGSAETFEDGRSGVLLPSAEAPSLEDVLTGIDTLFESGQKQRKMSTAARKIARERFDLQSVLDNSMALFSGTEVCKAPEAIPRFLPVRPASAPAALLEEPRAA